jgi:hypothetical protein
MMGPGSGAAGASATVVPSGGARDTTMQFGATTTAAPPADSVARRDEAAVDSAEAVGDLDRYEQLLAETKLGRSDARETAAALRLLMPRLRRGDDSVRAGITLALALESAGDKVALCAVVRRLMNDERISPRARAVVADMRRDQCAPAPRRRPAPATRY